jgi:hypothetical protein
MNADLKREIMCIAIDPKFCYAKDMFEHARKDINLLRDLKKSLNLVMKICISLDQDINYLNDMKENLMEYCKGEGFVL